MCVSKSYLNVNPMEGINYNKSHLAHSLPRLAAGRSRPAVVVPRAASAATSRAAVRDRGCLGL